MDLNKLDHLIAVAEEGSVTRAASRVHLSQQALSTSIKALEREIGVSLLDRNSGGARLLPAGQALVDDARTLDGLARSALHRARRIGRGEPETLRIGHTPAVTGEEVTAWLQQATDGQTHLDTLVMQRYPSELIAELTAGSIDLGLCRSMRPPRGLSRALLGHHKLRLAVSADHHLANKNQILLPDLVNECILVWGHPGRSAYTDLLIEHCRQAGFEPHVERTPLQGTPPATAVLNSNKVAFVTEPFGTSAGDRVHVIDLQPTIYAPLHGIWHQYTSSEARDTLLDAQS